jgi:Zn-dependent M32 family carboxypeptidase
VGWDPKNEVMKEAWDNVNEKIESVRQKVITGELSPIAYYIEKNIMDVGLLAKYMGYWKWTIKKHLKPKYFNKLSDEVLEKYAKVFDISKEELINSEL